MGLRPIGVGAGEQHQHVGAAAERAPRLDAVDDVAGRPVRVLGGRGGDLEAGHVAAEVGLGHRDGGHHLGRGELGQPVLLLLLGPALDERPGEDLGARDQRAADPQAGPAELLGGDDHGQVLAVAALAVAAVLGRHRQPEGADLGQPADDVLGHVAVRAVHVLGLRGHDVVGERAERVLHHLHVRIEMTRPARLGQARQERRFPVGGEEGMGGPQGVGAEAPQLLPAGQPADQIVDHVGGERAGDAPLGVALAAVVEQRAGSGRGRCRMREVVGQDLVGVRTAHRR